MGWYCKSFLTIFSCCSFVSLTALQIADGEFALGYTFREDGLHWSIADIDNMPNILSELTWEDLRINQVSAFARAVTTKQLYGRAFADYGRIYHGKNRDSDYGEDNRKEEFSRSISNAGKGEVFDLSAALGYQFQFNFCRLRFVPLIGVSWEEQHLRLYDGIETLPEVEPIEGLHSSYKTRWYGPWLGFDLDYDLNENVTFIASFEYHWTVYRGIGHWNLREDLLTDFKHRSHGTGAKCQGGILYALSGNWNAAFLAGFETWSTTKGTHRVTIDTFEGIEDIKTRLNGVFWHSFRLSAMLTYLF